MVGFGHNWGGGQISTKEYDTIGKNLSRFSFENHLPKKGVTCC